MEGTVTRGKFRTATARTPEEASIGAGIDSSSTTESASKTRRARKQRGKFGATTPEANATTASVAVSSVSTTRGRKNRGKFGASPAGEAAATTGSVLECSATTTGGRKSRGKFGATSPVEQEESVNTGDVETQAVVPGAARVYPFGREPSTWLQDNDEEASLPSDSHTIGLSVSIRDREQQDDINTSNVNFIAEARLVHDGATDITAEDRERIEEETKKKIYSGAAEAHVVLDDDDSKVKRRKLALIGLAAILCVVIVGVTVGVVVGRSNASMANTGNAEGVALTTTSLPSQFLSHNPSVTPSSVPTEALLDNNLCHEAHEVVIGTTIETSLTNATRQFGKACNHGSLPLHPGLFYRYRGTGAPVSATVSDGLSLDVYTTCSLATCLPSAIFKKGGLSWEANAGTNYIIKVSAASEMRFVLMLANNDMRESAFGPIDLGTATNTIMQGTTDDGASIDSEVQSCGAASSSTAPGVWYSMLGNGKTMQASTCDGIGFDAQLSVFTVNDKGSSSEELQCIDGSQTGCANGRSLVIWESTMNEVYYVLVHGIGTASGRFLLQLSTVGAAIVSGNFCGNAIALQLDKTVPVDLTTATEDIGIDRCYHPTPPPGWREEDFPLIGIWYSVTGTGNLMTAAVQIADSSATDDVVMNIYSGTCSQLTCIKPCSSSQYYGITSPIDNCQWESNAGEKHYVLVHYSLIAGLSGALGPLLLMLSQNSTI